MKKEALDLLIQLVNIPSVNSKDNERVKAYFIADYFKKHGMKTEIEEIDESHANVYAYVDGRNPAETIVMNGHMDTVPYGNTSDWQTDPAVASLKEGKLYGRGTSDMQSGLAAIMYALTHLEEMPSSNICFIATGDEEKGGLGAGRVMQSHARLIEHCRYILIGEPTALHVGIAQKGCLWVEIHVCGKASHGAYPADGINAIESAMRVARQICAFVQTTKDALLGASTAQINRMDGGVASNITADQCSFTLDIRLVPGVSENELFTYMEEIFRNEERKSGVNIAYHLRNQRKSVATKPEAPCVLQLKQLVEKQRRAACETVGTNYFTDASIFTAANHKDVILFGPGEPKMCHKPNEYVDIEQYYTAIEIITRLVTEK